MVASSSIPGFLKSIPSGRNTSIACLLFAIFCKITLVCIFYTIDRDMMLQGIAGKNFAEGHGLSIGQVYTADLSKLIYTPLKGWPPGYSLLVAFFYTVLNSNLIASCLVISILAFIAFIILFRKLLILLGFPSSLINLLLFFTGVNIPDYLQRSMPTDMIALVFCLWGIYLLLIFITNPRKKASFGIMLGIVNSMAAVFRYMYVGTGIVIPLVLMWIGFYKKDKRLLLGGFYSMGITVLVTAGILSFQHAYTGSSFFTRPAEQGFFFQNLQYIHPFALSSIMNLDFYSMQISNRVPVSYIAVMQVAVIIGLVLLVPLLWIFATFCLRTKLQPGKRMDIFFMTGGFISIAVLSILIYVSIRNNIHYSSFPEFDWTYIAEGRYFAFVWIFLQIFFTWALFVYQQQSLKKNIRILQWIFLLTISVEILHGGYFIAKYFVSDVKHVPLLVGYEEKSLMQKIISENKEKKEKLVFTSPNELFYGEAWLAGQYVLYDFEEINQPVIAASTSTMLIACIRKDELDHFKNFLGRKETRRIGETTSYYFFADYIEPIGTKPK